MSDGIGCMCAASSASDCCCDDVDWTPQIVYDLQKQLSEAQKQNVMLREALGYYTNKMVSSNTVFAENILAATEQNP